MQVLVTGANGFVGRALLARLSKDPATRVRAAVRHGVDHQSGPLEWVQAPDLSETCDWAAALKGVQAVVHLAARVHVMADRASDPLAEYRRVNVAGTLALARQAAVLGVRRFLFLSSVKVNGESTVPGAPFTESDPPAPTDPYGISKAEAEEALFALGRSSGMEIVVIRCPLVYGPGVKANFLSMIRWLQRGIPLPFGALEHNRRSLVAVDNLVELLRDSMHHPAAANQVFFAADGEDLSTTALLCRTASALGVRPHLIRVPPRALALAFTALGRRSVWQRLGGSLQVDTSKARRLLAWSPPVSVDEGLRRALQPIVRAGR